MSKRNTYNTEFKVAAVARMLDEGEAPSTVSRDLGVTHDPIEDMAAVISCGWLYRCSGPAKERCSGTDAPERRKQPA